MHRILVVGSGGREHALAWRLGRDPSVERVIAAPGNDGLARDVLCVAARETDADALADIALRESITLVVVGPEAPLAAGVADALSAAGIPVFGPMRAAAQLEASKWTAKQIMAEASVPAARGALWSTLPEALAALDTFDPPWVIKADGLAAGKGVCVTSSRAEAETFARECLVTGKFGEAGRHVLIEEHLEGEEASVMAISDGERFVMLPAARDYKRAHDGDRGPNTGGMGAFAPSDAVTPALEEEIAGRIVAPTLEAMRRRGTPYRGVLYAGLMLTATGPRVIEFNARFGDPETEAVLPLIDGSFADLLAGAAAGSLDPTVIRRGEGVVVSVAIVAEDYPDHVTPGGVIEGLDRLAASDDVMVFHAGTARDGERWMVHGGRAVHVAARGASRDQARRRVYEAIATLGGSGWRVRGDIAGAGAGTGTGGGMASDHGGLHAAPAGRGASWR